MTPLGDGIDAELLVRAEEEASRRGDDLSEVVEQILQAYVEDRCLGA